MLRKPNFIYANFCLFCLLVTMHWADVISTAATATENSNPASHKQLEQKNENHARSNEVELYREEFNSNEYADDLMETNNNYEDNNEWDILIFSQSWPVTTCYHWREEDKNHKCLLPDKKEYWIIHGIWPTKFEELGPFFCNKSAQFDVDQLQQIMDGLQMYWPEINGEVKYDWLWAHEWLKHGTCAASLEALNNELKYFSQGLQWSGKYFMSFLLGASSILPDSNHTVIALHAALVEHLGKNPAIYCLYDHKHDISYLDEIRLCFNKSLLLTDCDGVKNGETFTIDYPGGSVITNCQISKPVHYPSLVPQQRKREAEQKWQFPVVNLYKLVQFLLWSTF